MSQLGYACINMHLSDLPKSQRVTTNRSMIKRTFQERGLPYASELALANCRDLLTVLKWNEQHDIRFFRLSSDLFPWSSEYQLSDLPDYDAICDALMDAGDFAYDHCHRITTHPGPFNVLGSLNPDVVTKTIKELDTHAEIFDMLGLPTTPHAKINIHVGGAYGEHDKALARFCKNFKRLTHSAQSRLTVENDDKPNLYSTKMLYEGVHKQIGIPIVFDSHHFECGPQDVDYEESLLMAIDSWPKGITPVCHHSNSKQLYENPKVMINAHSDWYYEPFNDCGFSLDVVLECKKKELALLKYREDFVEDAILAA